MTDAYQYTLLAGWEELYKKGQLSLWILLSLKQAPKNMSGIKEFVNDSINGRLETDDKSMYRSLRRLAEADMIGFELKPSPKGPHYKVYELTGTGQAVLQAFLQRNIISVFYKPHIRSLIEKG